MPRNNNYSGPIFVIPAQAGIFFQPGELPTEDSRLRGNDEERGDDAEERGDNEKI